MANVGLFLPSN